MPEKDPKKTQLTEADFIKFECKLHGLNHDASHNMRQ